MTINFKEIIKRICDIIPHDKKILLMDVYDGDTGEILGEKIPIFKKDFYINRKIRKNPKEPYVELTMRSDIVEHKFLDSFTRNEKGYLFDLFRSVDGYGRIKYGNNYQQYCRCTEDFTKVLNTSYETLRRNLIPKMKEYDIIRTVKIEKGSGYVDESYISFNPVLVTNGIYWDRWTLITWLDVVREFNLLTEKEIKDVLGK